MDVVFTVEVDLVVVLVLVVLQFLPWLVPSLHATGKLAKVVAVVGVTSEKRRGGSAVATLSSAACEWLETGCSSR